MTRPARSLEPRYFQALYDADPDPWRFASSDYEAAKYAATLAALPRPSYRRAFEVGCSIGVLTRQLAARCESLLAVDVVPDVLEEARLRCADRPGVALAQMRVPEELPQGPFDLILLSEVAYYWSALDLGRVAAFADEALQPGGDIVLVHWTGETDYPLSGDEAARRFIVATEGFCGVVNQERAELYRIDVLRRHAG